ncbi:MAG TPA: hypothetical protein VN923_20640, partial [Thermoanaerobaculia bacterium]|nr:hypothetical protein [Thermoanaerobaculia bacterium]
QNRYDKWLFTVEMLTQTSPAMSGQAPSGGAVNAQMPMRWIGRPFRPNLVPVGVPLPGMPPPGGDYNGPAPPPPGLPPPPPPQPLPQPDAQ